MEFQHIIQLSFYNGKDEMAAYWLPGHFCFTFSVPRALISQSDLAFELAHAEQHARQVLQGRPFLLRARAAHFAPVTAEGRPA